MVDNAKGILEFDREEHEKEFLCAVHGSDLVKIIWSLDQEFLRRHIKYGQDDPNLVSYDENTLQAVRDYLYGLLGEQCIDIDYLVS